MVIVNPRSLAPPQGYNHGIVARAGALLFVAGQVAWDRNGEIVGDRFADQFEQALANVLAIVTEAGGLAESIVKLSIFVADTDEYLAARGAVGAAYRRLMGKHFPAMTLVQVGGFLEPGARVEIEGVAVIADGHDLDRRATTEAVGASGRPVKPDSTKP